MPSYFLAFITALIAVYALTPLVIKFAVKTGAMDKPDPRKVHKKPIPRLGGLAIYLAFMIAVCSMLDFSKEIVGLLLGGTFIVIVGIIDDFISLPAKVKLLGQILAACILVAFDIRIDFITDPFGDFIFLEYLAIPVTIFWIVGITNTVNLIDGLDGLAAGVSTIATVTILLVALQSGDLPVVFLTAALAGASLGFLHYNFNPARIFMGDTGSLALGGFVAGTAYVLQMPLFLLLVGLIYFVEVLSVMIQVTYFKATHGKRIFKMAPIHHHFELCGWSEARVVAVFTIVTAIMCLIGLLAL